MHNQRAYQFFKDLEQYLDQRIPPPETIRNEIDIVEEHVNLPMSVIRLSLKALSKKGLNE